jgi:hypothetical protein
MRPRTGRPPSRRLTLTAVDYREYMALAAGRWARLGELGEYGRVVEAGREYPLLRLIVPGGPEDRWVTITAGFHGEEPAGPR